MITYLDWDSDFFNLRIGSSKENITLKRLLSEKSKLSFDLVYVFRDCPFHEDILPVDTKVTFQKKVSVQSITDQVESYLNEDYSKLIELSLQSGRCSRFKIDSQLASSFKRLYAEWIKKSVNGIMADEVFVWNDQVIKGFITVKRQADSAHIGLLSVDSNYQGEGIGKALVSVVENWCVQHEVRSITVPTQQKNVEACQFYAKCGFVLKDTKYIYHI